MHGAQYCRPSGMENCVFIYQQDIWLTVYGRDPVKRMDSVYIQWHVQTRGATIPPAGAFHTWRASTSVRISYRLHEPHRLIRSCGICRRRSLWRDCTCRQLEKGFNVRRTRLFLRCTHWRHSSSPCMVRQFSYEVLHCIVLHAYSGFTSLPVMGVCAKQGSGWWYIITAVTECNSRIYICCGTGIPGTFSGTR